MTDILPPIPVMQPGEDPTLAPKPVELSSRRRRIAAAAIMVTVAAAVGCAALVVDHHATEPDGIPASTPSGTPESGPALAGSPTDRREGLELLQAQHDGTIVLIEHNESILAAGYELNCGEAPEAGALLDELNCTYEQIGCVIFQGYEVNCNADGLKTPFTITADSHLTLNETDNQAGFIPVAVALYIHTVTSFSANGSAQTVEVAVTNETAELHDGTIAMASAEVTVVDNDEFKFNTFRVNERPAGSMRRRRGMPDRPTDSGFRSDTDDSHLSGRVRHAQFLAQISGVDLDDARASHYLDRRAPENPSSAKMGPRQRKPPGHGPSGSPNRSATGVQRRQQHEFQLEDEVPFFGGHPTLTVDTGFGQALADAWQGGPYLRIDRTVASLRWGQDRWYRPNAAVSLSEVEVMVGALPDLAVTAIIPPVGSILIEGYRVRLALDMTHGGECADTVQARGRLRVDVSGCVSFFWWRWCYISFHKDERVTIGVAPVMELDLVLRPRGNDIDYSFEVHSLDMFYGTQDLGGSLNADVPMHLGTVTGTALSFLVPPPWGIGTFFLGFFADRYIQGLIEDLYDTLRDSLPSRINDAARDAIRGLLPPGGVVRNAGFAVIIAHLISGQYNGATLSLLAAELSDVGELLQHAPQPFQPNRIPCIGSGLVEVLPDSCIDDFGRSAGGQSLEIYCIAAIMRTCLSHELCPWSGWQEGQWERCSYEGGTCQCHGQVRYGHARTSTWSDSHRVTGQTPCSNGVFGDPFAGVSKECQCSPDEDAGPAVSRIACGETKTGDTSNTANHFGNPANDALFGFTVVTTSSFEFDTCGSSYDTWVRVLDSRGSQMASCDDCGGCGTRTILQTPNLGPGEYTLVIEGYRSSNGAFTVTMNGANGGECTGTGVATAPETETARASCASNFELATCSVSGLPGIDMAHKVCGTPVTFGCDAGSLTTSVPTADLPLASLDNPGMRICFVELEGSSQCQGNRFSCSGYSSAALATAPFRDDTDGRGGGCKYAWKMEASRVAANKEYRLCFTETERSSQCQGNRNSCTAWGDSASWTAPFRDDTDGRGGGCRYQWRIDERPRTSTHEAPQKCRVCFQETEGSSQCQPTYRTRATCSGWSNEPAWTLPFRDDTDGRGGGCRYQWNLECTTV